MHGDKMFLRMIWPLLLAGTIWKFPEKEDR